MSRSISRAMLVTSACLYLGILALWMVPLRNDTWIFGGHHNWVLIQEEYRPGFYLRPPWRLVSDTIHLPFWVLGGCALVPAAAVLIGRRAGFVRAVDQSVVDWSELRPQWIAVQHLGAVFAWPAFVISILSLVIILTVPLAARYLPGSVVYFESCYFMWSIVLIPLLGALVSKRLKRQRKMAECSYGILVASLLIWVVLAWINPRF